MLRFCCLGEQNGGISLSLGKCYGNCRGKKNTAEMADGNHPKHTDDVGQLSKPDEATVQSISIGWEQSEATQDIAGLSETFTVWGTPADGKFQVIEI